MNDSKNLSKGLKHGDKFKCPTCGAPGRIDLNSSSKIAEFERSIWYNKQIDFWECSECWLK